jgi:hypothetical protein
MYSTVVMAMGLVGEVHLPNWCYSEVSGWGWACAELGLLCFDMLAACTEILLL